MTEFNPEMLVLARESRGLTQKELAQKLNIAQGTLSKIENGLLLETDEYLEAFSQVLSYPQSFFHQREELYKPGEYFFRKKISASKKDVDKAEALTNIVRLSINRLLNSVELKEPEIPIWNVEEFGPPVMAAKYLREYWKLPKGPIENLTTLLEDHGILIIDLDFGSPKLDGLSLFSSGGNPIIFVNRNMPSDRQRLTVAHELAHLVLHCRQIIQESRDVETEAFEFASEFLMPSREISSRLSKLTLQKLADLKRYWKVSMAAIIMYARSLRTITDNQYKYLWIQMGTNGYRVKEPVELDFPQEIPLLTREIINAHLDDLGYSIEELSSVVHMAGTEFSDRFLFEPPKFFLKRAI
ncbi:MAG TPA: XRE family transcriptional regulator [Cyclobacteriaceae bacterium]|nr:XRE family transcriptional regulator [Cyclobacteriaceae bacterium]